MSPTRPVSDAFLRALSGSHGGGGRARVVATGQTGTDPDGTDIPIHAGGVDLDATAEIRSKLDLVTVGTWPGRDSTALLPYGATELFVERGVQFGGGTTEWVSLGYFRIQGPRQDSAPTGAVQVRGRDRMAGIVDADLTSPRQFAASETYGDALAALVEEVYPWATIEWDDATDTEAIGRSLLAEESRFAFCDELVRSLGKIWYWDHRGVLVVKDLPDPGSPVFGVTHGAGGVLIELSREISRDGVYNGVVASGEAADTQSPARAVVVDLNPASPTYWHGNFGQVPRKFTSPFITDDVQAARAAETILRQSLGLPYTVEFTAVVNPALEPYDPVRVSLPGGAETHVLETLTVPLTANTAMPASTREQTVVQVGAP